MIKNDIEEKMKDDMKMILLNPPVFNYAAFDKDMKPFDIDEDIIKEN